MDWLRSEDLKEEKNVTAPIVIIAVHAVFRFEEVAGRTIGHAPNESIVFWHRSRLCSRKCPSQGSADEEEDDEEEHDSGEEDDDEDEGYLE